MAYKNKETRNAWTRQYRAKNREKLRLGSALYRKENADYWYRKNLLYRAKERAKNCGVPFDLEHGDIVVPGFCPYLGIPIRRAKTRPDDFSPSIDRIVPELGYVRGNIEVISNRANVIKNCGTAAEHRLIADRLDYLISR